MKRVLIVDDDMAVTNYFLVALTQTETYEPVIVNDSRGVPALLAQDHFDVIVLDLDMPDVSGVDILKHLRGEGIRTPVIVLTGVGDVELAVKSMKLGAFDYLTKPVDDDHFLEVLGEAVEHGALQRSLKELPPQPRREDLAHPAAFEAFVTSDPRMIRLFHEAERMAAGNQTVLVVGEQGTGREMLARAMHGIGARRAAPFVVADVSACAAAVLPSLLFGQAKSWRGVEGERKGLIEQAAGGTLFIDHVERMDVPVQMRLKRVIQTNEFYRERSTHVMKADARLIVGSTEDLASADYKGAFSRDLLYHLTANALRIPSLRERPGDIPLLAEHALRREAGKAGKRIEGLAPEALGFLAQFPFPGNERELESVVATAVSRCGGSRLSLDDLPACLREAAAAVGHKKLADVERDYVLQVLQHCGGDRAKAAAELGIAVPDLDRILGPENGSAPR